MPVIQGPGELRRALNASRDSRRWSSSTTKRSASSPQLAHVIALERDGRLVKSMPKTFTSPSSTPGQSRVHLELPGQNERLQDSRDLFSPRKLLLNIGAPERARRAP